MEPAFQARAVRCRFIQLPVNLGMPEAWQGGGHSWPDLASQTGQPGNGSVLQAAARLGVGVFGSAPLQEGQLLGNAKLVVRGRGWLRTWRTCCGLPGCMQQMAGQCAVFAGLCKLQALDPHHANFRALVLHTLYGVMAVLACQPAGCASAPPRAAHQSCSGPQAGLGKDAALANVPEAGPKLLQLARSTPLLTGAVVGHKGAVHVRPVPAAPASAWAAMAPWLSAQHLPAAFAALPVDRLLPPCQEAATVHLSGADARLTRLCCCQVYQNLKVGKAPILSPDTFLEAHARLRPLLAP